MPSAVTYGVAGETGERSCFGSGSAHISDDDGPALVIDAENVVEVAADLGALTGGPVPHCDLEVRDLRQRSRQQAALQGVGDAVLLRVESAVLETRRNASGDRLSERDVVEGVTARRTRHHELHGPEDPTPLLQRDRDR